MESLKALLNDFDPSVLLPDLSAVPAHLVEILRAALMTAPLILLGLGLLYFLASPREANYTIGFRCRRGMASVEAWQFTQRLAGITWGVLGLGLCIVMSVLSARLGGMETEAMAMFAVRCILWELGLVIASILGINITLIVLFDRHGVRRVFERPAKTEQTN